MPRQPAFHLLRSLMLTLATLFFFTAIKTNPIPNALTLLFVSPLIVAMLAPFVLGERFDIFVGIGVFPKPSFPRVIWIGTNEGVNELEKLAEMIRIKLSQLGFRPDKKFKPHVTIFRVKNKIEGISDKLEKFSSYSFGKQMIYEIKLKKSELTPEGPIYTDVLVVKGKK